jgi:hypothetical protein
MSPLTIAVLVFVVVVAIAGFVLGRRGKSAMEETRESWKKE